MEVGVAILRRQPRNSRSNAPNPNNLESTSRSYQDECGYPSYRILSQYWLITSYIVRTQEPPAHASGTVRSPTATLAFPLSSLLRRTPF